MCVPVRACKATQLYVHAHARERGHTRTHTYTRTLLGAHSCTPTHERSLPGCHWGPPPRLGSPREGPWVGDRLERWQGMGRVLGGGGTPLRALFSPPQILQAIIYEGQDKNPEMCRVLLTHEIMCR